MITESRGDGFPGNARQRAVVDKIHKPHKVAPFI